MKKNIPYPVILKVMWRFARVFIAVFAIQFFTGFVSVETLADGKALLIPALSAGLVAVGKAVREYFKENRESVYETIKVMPV